MCLLALSFEVFTLPAPTPSRSHEVPLTNPDHFSLDLFHFCRLHIQALSFQGITHSFSQRSYRNPLLINHFRTLFAVTGVYESVWQLAFMPINRGEAFRSPQHIVVTTCEN